VDVRHRGLALSVLLLAGACGMATFDARAEDSMRCGSRLVSRGDAKDKVLALCGEPTSVSQNGYVRRSPIYRRGDPFYMYDYYSYCCDMPVEIWTYNFGTHKLVRKLRFVGDELDDIDTAGYGY
jgi:hypothetical protein